MRRALVKIVGIEGLLLLLFALIAFLFAPGARILALIFLVAGVLCGGFYLVVGWQILKGSVASRSARFGASAATYTLIVLSILVLVNFVVQRHPKEWDATSARVNTLSDQTLKVLGNLKAGVKVLHFQRPVESAPMEKLLARYDYASEFFTYQIVDPDKDPQLVQMYEIKSLGDSVAVFGEKKYRFTGTTEEDVTNALIQATKSAQQTVYFVEGHGEPDLDDRGERGFQQIGKALANESYQAVKLLLASQKTMPEDAAAIVVAGPKKPFLEHEIQLLSDYLKQGGKVLFLLDPAVETGLEPLVAEYGIALRNTVIVDQFVTLFQGAQLGLDIIAEDYAGHPAARDFKERTVFPQARSLELAQQKPEGVTLQELARSSRSSWAETNLDRLMKEQTVELDDADTKGPVVVAATAEKRIAPEKLPEAAEESAAEGEAAAEEEQSAAGAEPEKKEEPAAPTEKRMRIAVVGDSDFATNQFANYLFNTDFFLNTLAWLVGEEARISIRPRSYAPALVEMSRDEHALVFYLSVFIIPQLMLMLGIAVMVRRSQS